ncbi:2-deoxy-5-keto-D-gluconate 6-phosphate aldolase domain-containing protein [uncultured Amnibacterium sp.]|uniref:2-deoxy-5-keto-D-gluconate 6-phosphate aldolase domain-containing protein n=1 Tax=uncultured Amnibacterium sp. TaxID=1631851 RepID=UPI0035C982B3
MPDTPIFLLAMDHRSSLAKSVYGLDGEAEDGSDDFARISAGKGLVFTGLEHALTGGAPRADAGVLVDERYGADVARRAKQAGITLAMPFERSGEEWFTLEYGSLDETTWLDHIHEFEPDLNKVLVRDNPDLDPAARRTQQRDLARASAALHEEGRTFLLELLVPGSDAQKQSAGDRYDADVRPGLTLQVIRELQDAGVEPDIWKIEGLDDPADAERIVALTQRDGRDAVRCIVLGRDAPQSDLDRWLRIAAPVDGFIGFAIGRSIWEQPLTEQLQGDISEDELSNRVSVNYTHFVATYTDAQQSGEDRSGAPE